MQDVFVEPSWLERRIGDSGLVILDCGWHLPESGKNAADDFRAGHIPGARHFDLNVISDRASPYVNMMPGAEQFARDVGALGVGNDSQIVVYDSGYVAPRVRWMFRAFGHDDVRILDGGFRRWKAEGRPVETGAATIASRVFTAAPREGMIATWRDTLATIETNPETVLDARTAERFSGEQPSGYPGVPGGHMPGALNLPWSRFLKSSGDFRFADPETADAILTEAGVGRDGPFIATCGSGVTAALLGLMLERTGRTDWRLYDGSWHEWGQRPDLPKKSAGA